MNTDIKELNYSSMEVEHQELLAKIRASHAADGEETSIKAKRDKEKEMAKTQVSLSCSAAPKVKLVDYDDTVKQACSSSGAGIPLEGADFAQDDGSFMEGRITVTARMPSGSGGGKKAERLSFMLECPGFIVPEQKSWYFARLGGGNLEFEFTYKVLATVLASNLTGKVVCTYFIGDGSGEGGEARCANCEFEIPLGIVVRPVAPVKAASYKINFDCSRTPPSMGEVFADVFECSEASSAVY